MKKNGFLTFCFSFIPGAGQMYQRYMKRGLSLMVIAGLTVVLTVMSNEFLFCVPFLITMAYSFFDTFHLRNMTDDERKEYKDDYVWNKDSVKEFIPDFMRGKKNKVIGLILLVLGLYFVLDNILVELTHYEMFRMIYDYYHYSLPAILVSIACIILGIKMIKE